MNGVLSTWDRDQYDADTTRVRSTSMKSLVSAQGPRAFYLNHLRAREPAIDANDDYSPKSGPIVLGTLFHELVIDGKVGWHVNANRRGTTAWKVCCKRNAGTVALSKKDDATLWAWREAIDRNAEAREMLASGSFGEQVILWDQPVTFADADGAEHTVNVPSKCAIDLFSFAGQFACIKTTRAGNLEEWERELERKNYPFSAAFYQLGIRSIPEFAGYNEPIKHIVLCKQPPYYCYVKPLDKQWMLIGMGQVAKAFERYARCTWDMEHGVEPLAAWPDLLERTQLDPATPSMRAMERHGALAGEAI